MPEGLEDHPLRAALTAEVHARPFARLQAPERVTYLAMLSGEAGAGADRAHVGVLLERFDGPPPDEGASHAMADLGAFRFKWERHSEFSSYSFFRRRPPDGAPFTPGGHRLVLDEAVAAHGPQGSYGPLAVAGADRLAGVFDHG